MERKTLIVPVVTMAATLVISMFTLLLCSCNGGQVVYQEQDTAMQRERILITLRNIIKVRQRIYCLSTDIKQASDTNKCFNCHDKIER